MARVLYDHVTKMFDDVVAVDDLLLDIRDGEFLVLVGPSGCGKSTALRCVAGLEDVTSGDILIGDRSVTKVHPRNRDIAMVFQSYALYPHMTVYDNLAFGLKLRKLGKQEIKRRIEVAAEILGIGALLERQPRQLSGGQRQRVALGRAIVREPQVFLMDEPLSNLDAKLRVYTRAELSQLQHRLGTTTIYVTHDQVEAMTMGHRIAVMNHGLLQQLDTPQHLYDNPANLFVATFMGSPAMNVFRAEVISGGGGVRVVADGIDLLVPARRAERLAGHIGREVYAGIRPEHLSVGNGNGADGSREGQTARLLVELVEPLGSEQLAHLRGPNGQVIVARLDPGVPLAIGGVAELVVDLDALHAFDVDTEEALT